MSMSDPLGDMLTRIRNGQVAKMASVECPASHFRKRVLEVLQREGYIRGFSETQKKGGHPVLDIELKYHDGVGCIRKIDRVSKPGRRVYAGIKDFGRVFNGLGISILSTPNGVLSDNEARTQNVGGEVLCRVF
ncbi:MAG: 30S ribosomal protein S8 [Alphaproteobacteria bacterium]|nr:30S ribosomal protein S8 [Alphaproteobacteria bacterium]